MTQLHVARVFLGPGDTGGNPLGVFVDGTRIPAGERQEVARELGFSETVFVDEVAAGGARIAIFTPGTELPFAGHPSVGTSWLLRELGRPVEVLHERAGDVDTWLDGQLTWIRARPEWVFGIEVEQLDSPQAVEALTGAAPGKPSWYAWAWIDEAAGVLRSRFFVDEISIAEDEATGAAAVVMGGLLGRPLTIRQGVGSELHARPGPNGTVEVGGRSRLDEVRDYPG